LSSPLFSPFSTDLNQPAFLLSPGGGLLADIQESFKMLAVPPLPDGGHGLLP
jgi:hypothetical protein